MNRVLSALVLVLYASLAFAQTNPAITTWLRNNTGIKGRHYVAGNSTPINDTYPANVQSVKYSSSWVYVTCSGIPSYVIGPYLDGNPSQGINENNIYKIPLSPVKNTGTPSPTTGGTIGVFINGVSLFDYRDGVSYNISSGTNQGGPLGGMGNMVWNRDAVVAERVGFDCAKGHPAMGNYHHHQNPSAFKLDLKVISNICDLYLSDALYVIDSTVHSPLLGFAYDGFPIYGAYGYKNVNGTGGIVRMKSSYSLRNITDRTHYADGTDVTDGPPVSAQYPLGMYREDYQYNPTSSSTPDYLDAHNGRFCVTPEYPNGTYAYFATVDQFWNSAYPYVVGPTFYGVKSTTRVTGISEITTTYNGPPLTATAAITPIACKGGATGAINLTISGGNPPFTYNWGGGITTKNRTGLVAGTYTVTITDVTAQTVTQTAIVTEPQAALTATATALPAACFGAATGAISLTVAGGTPGYTLAWNDSDTAQVRTTLPAATYSVTITDANHCTATISQTVTQPTAPLSVTATTTPVACFGNSTGAIQLGAAGGTSAYTYTWNDGNTNPNRTAIPAGTYTATVTDAHNCTATVAQMIAQPATPLSTTVSFADVACFGNASGGIQLTTLGGTSGYTIAWSDGNTNAIRTGLTPGLYTATITDANQCTTTIEQSIQQPAGPLTASTAVEQIACFGQATGAIDLTLAGGTPGYAVVWNDGATTPGRQDLTAGMYTTTVTDANGCTTIVADTIDEPSLIQSAVAEMNATCGYANGSAQLFALGGHPPYTYGWSNGNTTSSLDSIASGTFTVTITDAYGCTVQQTALISNQDGPVASTVTVPVGCFGGTTGAINLLVSGGTLPLTYQWSDGATTVDRTDLPAGNYIVTVMDANHCTTIISETITQPTALTGAVTSSPEACSKQNGAATLTLAGGTAPYVYHWSNGSTDADLTVLTAGDYTATVTDEHGCSATYTTTVDALAGPTATATSLPASCFGSATGAIQTVVNGGTQPYTYLWSTGSTAADLTKLPQGAYTGTITDANGCTILLTADVAQPAAPVSIQGHSTNVTCYGWENGGINLTVNGGTGQYAFVWNTAATTQSLSGLGAGSYTVTVTDANGCTTELVQYVQQPAVALYLNYYITNINCYGQATGGIDLSAAGGTPAYNYNWGGGLNVSSLNHLTVGIYTVTVNDANGCTLTFSPTLTQPAELTAAVQPTPSTGSDGQVVATGAGGTPPYTFAWINGANSNPLTDLAPGTYTVTIADAHGCTATASTTVDLATATTNPLDNVVLKIFPNPGSELILIQSQVILRNTLHLDLVNAAGQIVLSKDFLQGSTICHFETDTLYDGIYFLRATDGETSKTFKVVIRR